MTNQEFQISEALWPRDAEAMRAVRNTVFVEEQKVPAADEWDGLDPLCRHALARTADGLPIGTGRLTPQHTLGRMAVLGEWRGKGVGQAILEHLLERATILDWSEVEIHAQDHAVAFYAKRGFEPFGEPFDECGIRHVKMRLDLRPGSSRKMPWRTDSREELLAAMLEIAGAANNELRIRTRELDPGLLDEPGLLEAIQRIATGGRRAMVRILVHDTDRGLRDGHGLIELGQRLSSSIEFRRPVEQADRGHAGALFVNDAGDYLFRPNSGRYEAEGERGARGRARTLADDFDAVWDRSESCVELRRLAL